MRYFLMLILLFTSLVCLAAIYLQKDTEGNFIYSDTPLAPNAQPINSTQRSSTLPVLEPATPPVTPLQKNTKNKPYTTFLIISPTNQETIQNQPTITISIHIEPKLQPGDKIQLYIDGKMWGNPEASTQITLDHIDRGMHQLYATLLNQNGASIKQSNSVTLYVHYASVK